MLTGSRDLIGLAYLSVRHYPLVVVPPDAKGGRPDEAGGTTCA